MTYEDLIRIAVETGTDGIDLTVYWLPEHDRRLPAAAAAPRLQESRRDLQHRHARPARAADGRNCGTSSSIELRKWLDVAQKLGATHVRVFGGEKPDGATLEQAIGFAAETLKRGAE